MEQIWSNLLLAIIASTLLYLALTKLNRSTKSQNLPPSPPSFPIIGHMHLLKQPIHRTLRTLSEKYGDLFLIKAGSVKLLIVSSPEAVEECFSTNDVTFANRPMSFAGDLIHYGNKTIGSSSYGDHWRHLKRLTMLELFSPGGLQEFAPMREHEISLMVKEVSDKCQGFTKARIAVRSMCVDVLFNIVTMSLCGKRYYGPYANVRDEETKQFRSIINELTGFTRQAYLGDFFPVFRKFDIRGVGKKMKALHNKMDAFLQEIVDEHRAIMRSAGGSESKRKTVVGSLLSRQETKPELHSDFIIKGIILAMLQAGVDTTSTVLEWSLTMLLNNPNVMKKALTEMESICGTTRLLTDEDLPKLNYVRNIVKETLRLFPPAPLSLPHKSSADTKIRGFDVPRETNLMVNLWAIQRDPKLWTNPDDFIPERFEDESVDGGGHKNIPFGVGRRACPGYSLSYRILMLTLGSLVQCFEWERIGDEEIDLTEGIGITLGKKDSLEALCVPRKHAIDLLSSTNMI